MVRNTSTPEDAVLSINIRIVPIKHESPNTTQPGERNVLLQMQTSSPSADLSLDTDSLHPSTTRHTLRKHTTSGRTCGLKLYCERFALSVVCGGTKHGPVKNPVFPWFLRFSTLYNTPKSIGPSIGPIFGRSIYYVSTNIIKNVYWC